MDCSDWSMLANVGKFIACWCPILTRNGWTVGVRTAGVSSIHSAPGSLSLPSPRLRTALGDTAVSQWLRSALSILTWLEKQHWISYAKMDSASIWGNLWYPLFWGNSRCCSYDDSRCCKHKDPAVACTKDLKRIYAQRPWTCYGYFSFASMFFE